jgi:hypothetical protein
MSLFELLAARIEWANHVIAQVIGTISVDDLVDLLMVLQGLGVPYVDC